MNNYDRATNINEKNISDGVSKDNRELFKRALSDGLSEKIDKALQECKDTELPPPSKRHKIRMNRLFR